MAWIDSHAHLDDQDFNADRDAVMARLQAAGVAAVVNPGSSLAANAAGLELARRYPSVFAGAGLHPHEIGRLPEDWRTTLRTALGQERVVAVGETGLDYHRFPDLPAPDPEAQQAVFREQLRLARIFELPVIVHVREAFPDALRGLQAEGPFTAGGVIHCFSGGVPEAAPVLAMGLHIGVGGPVTYPRSQALQEVAKTCPLDRLLLETDAPYLPPQGRRGQRNEPAYLPEIGRAVAQVRGLDPEALAQATAENARRLFKLFEGDPGRLVYPLEGSLYVNITNRCSSHCRFCPRHTERRIMDFDLTLQREPSAEELMQAIGRPTDWRELIFCGFGEPTLRLPVLLAVARRVKALGGRVRVNSNGQANVVYARDILEECRGAVDAWSISLNTADPEQYQRLVQPATGPGTHAGVVAFIRRARETGFQVTVTNVEGSDVASARVRELAHSLGVEYRGRKQIADWKRRQ